VFRQRQWLAVLLLAVAPGALLISAPLPTPSPQATAATATPRDPQAMLVEEDRIAGASWLPRAQATRAERVAWWRDARFGMFIHWGVYSGLAGEWQGEPVKGYAEHIMRIKRIPRQVYLEKVAGAFNPTAFDADAWVKLAKRAGMKYLVITSKHHDGFAMFDSQVSPYNIVKATPFKRDPMRELREACRRQGIKFGFYYSHAFDWEYPDAPGNDWDYDNPGGDKQLHGGVRWYEQHPDLVARDERYVAQKAIPQVKELVAKYHPDILWFDTPSKQPPYLNLRILNALRQVDPNVIVNSRILQGVDKQLASQQATPAAHPSCGTGFADANQCGGEYHYADYQSTADRPAEFRPVEGDWEGIPTTNESYGYHKADRSHKPASHFVRLLAKAASKGGNLMLNIGPMGDGRIDPADVSILEGIGTWLDANGDSVYGAGRSPLAVQSWGVITQRSVSVVARSSSSAAMAAGTRAQPGADSPRLYLHVFDWPTAADDHAITVAGLQSNIRKAWLLTDKQQRALTVRRVNENDVAIALPDTAPDAIDTVIVADVEGAGPVRADTAQLLRARGETLLHVFDGHLSGEGARYDDGKANKDCVTEWTGNGAMVRWDVRVAEPVRLALAADYAASERHGGAFNVVVRDLQGVAPIQGLVTLDVKRTGGDQQFARHDLGTLALQPGHYTVTVSATRIDGELMRLRGLRWTPSATPTAAAP
jgi:alpha-L-fucosidase